MPGQQDDLGGQDSLRERVQRRVRSPISDEVWSSKIVRASVALFEGTNDPAHFEDLVQEVRTLRVKLRDAAGLRSTARKATRKTGSMRSALTMPESMRALAYSEVVAAAALDRSDVQGFRRTFLKDHWLSGNQADSFLNSPAIRLALWTRLVESQIPLIDLASEFVEAKVHDGGTWRAEVAIPLWDIRWSEQGSILPGSNRSAIIGADGVVVGQALASVRHSDGMPYNIGYWKTSVLAQAVDLSKALSKSFGWHERDGIWFLLTGEAPIIHPMESRLPEDVGGRVRILVSPWISDETLLSHMRKVRLATLGRSRPRAGQKNYEVFTFVERESRQAGGKRPNWRALVQAWNAAVTVRSARYEAPERFARDYSRAARVMRRDYTIGQLGEIGRFESMERDAPEEPNEKPGVPAQD